MRKFFLLLNIILAISLLGTIWSFINFYQKSKKEINPSAGENIGIKTQSKPLSYYSIIERKNIFSLSPLFKPPNSPPPVKKELNLKLKGTVVGKEAFSFAVIEDTKSRKQDLYRIGDTINNLKITAIKENEVILQSAEGQVSLTLSEKLPSSLAAPSSETEVRILSRQEVEEAKRNVNQLFSQVRISPFFKSGKMEGFRVSYIIPGSMVERMGIRKGDIIKKINGEAIDSPSKIFEFYRKFGNSNRIVVEVERNGKNESLVYQVGG
ncbi:MAG: hypothetical protein GXO71_03065 [Caldiserica bacterium]|nr:hypothetical protein [Caldisericota bacterium]